MPERFIDLEIALPHGPAFSYGPVLDINNNFPLTSL